MQHFEGIDRSVIVFFLFCLKIERTQFHLYRNRVEFGTLFHLNLLFFPCFSSVKVFRDEGWKGAMLSEKFKRKFVRDVKKSNSI